MRRDALQLAFRDAPGYTESMLFSPRITLSQMAPLCRRLATSLESGLEIRRILAREAAGRGPAALRRQLEAMSAGVARGESLADTIGQAGNYFPALFREMVHLGEQTGHLPEMFRHLAEHYEYQDGLRRQFLHEITGSLIRLSVALGIVGLAIWAMGFVPAGPQGERVDMLGFGLVGTPGLIRYLAFLAIVAAALAVVVQAVRRGAVWGRSVQRAVLALPVLGPALETLALARLAWSLQLTFGSGMDLIKALPLSLQTMQNARYTSHAEAITASIRRGQEVHEALAQTGAFSSEFLETLEVGERSGRLPESMALLSRQYQERAQRALLTLTSVAGFVVWALVAALIVFIVFRIFGFYLGQIKAAMPK